MSDSMIRAIDKLDGEVFGVLARNMPSRLIEVSRSGCLLESGHRMEDGTVGELRLEVDGELFVDDVRVTRCVRVEGSGSSYLVGAEFLQTRRPGEYSIRRAVMGILHGRTQHLNHTKKVSNHSETAAAVAAAPIVNSESTGEVS